MVSPQLQIVLRILGFLKRYKLYLLAAYLSLLISTVLSLAVPRLLGDSIDRVLANGQYSYLVYAAVAVVVLSLLKGLFAYGENYLRESLSQHVAYDLRNALYGHLQRLSFGYHDKQQTGQLMSRATADVENVRWFINLGVLRMSYLAVLLLSVSVVLITIDWRLAVVSLAVMPFVALRATIIGKRLRSVWLRIQEQTGELGAILQENLAGVRVVKAFSRQKHESQKFAAKSSELSEENLTANRVQASNAPLMVFVFTAITGLILWFGGREVILGRLTAGGLTQFILYLAMLQMPVRMVGFLVNLYSRAASSGQRIFDVLDAQSPVRERPHARDLKDVKGRVTFEGVSFNYNSVSPVLKDVSFEAKPGQVIALVGATGSGKTTIVSLIPRFYDVATGKVAIDGVDVRDVSLPSLRRNVGIVQQDVFLFSATVHDNIAYGRPGASKEKVVWAAKVARLHDFIAALPQGYETWVGERGITLSGGQKQRVAIARTLLLDPRILIMDDSTSSVDTETEYLIQQAMAELIKGRTTFIVAQRLTTVKKADMILVLKDGEIVERGRHEELVAADGPYRQIYEMQLRPQEEAGAQAVRG